MKKIFISFFIGIIFSVSAYASTDLLQVYQQALLSDQTFQSARAAYLAATEAYPQALAALLPAINLTGNVSTAYIKTYRAPRGLRPISGNLHGYTYNLSLAQPVINFGAWWGLHLASYSVRQATATYAAAAQNLLLRTAQAYFNILQAEDNVRFTESEKLANEKQLDQANQRFQVGLDAITSVYDAKASFDAVSARLISAKNDVENTKEKLREITGVYYKNLATLKQNMPLLTPEPNDIQKWIQKSDTYNFSLQAARFAMESARENIKVAFAGHLPTVNLQASRARTNLNGNDFIVPGSEDDRVDTVGLQLKLPIYQGGLISSQVREAQFDFQNAIAQMELTHRQVNVSLRQSYNSIMAGISKIKADEQAVISRQASLDSTEAALKVGTRTIVDLLLAQQQLFSAQTIFAADQYAYINNTLAFKALAGTLTYKDIASINTWLAGQGASRSPYKNKEHPQHLKVTKKSARPIIGDSLKKIPLHSPSSIKEEKEIKPARTSKLHKSLSTRANGPAYAIQLMADQQKTQVLTFVHRNGLKGKVCIHQTYVHGQRWYTLLYGHYSSETKAQHALSQLPQPLQTWNPWIKQVQK